MISTIAVPNRSVGVPLVMIAGICWSTSGLIYRLIENASPWQVLFYRSLALFVMLAIWLGVNYRKNFFSIFSNSIGLSIFAFFMMIIRSDEFLLQTMDWIYSSGMGIFQIGLGFLLFTSGARHLKAVELTLLSLTEIIAGPLLVWVFLDEAPSKAALSGGALILGAIVVLAVLGSNTKEENSTVLDSAV